MTPDSLINAQKPLGERQSNRLRARASVAVALLVSAIGFAQDRTLVFDVDAPGEDKSIDIWGLDTAWLWDQNVVRGVAFMGKPQVDVIRFSFTGDAPLGDEDSDGVYDSFTGTALSEFNERMRIVDTYTEPDTALYLNNDTTGGYDPYFWDGDSVHANHWAELIALTTEKAVEAGRTVLSVAPFNEPDCPCSFQGSVDRFGEVAAELRANFPAFDYGADSFIRIMGGNTLNNDYASSWYIPLNNDGWLEEGNTHQLAGSMQSYIDFFSYVESKGDLGTNDELHNVMEAMVGAEYGMDAGIWWGTAEYARGEFVKTSDGKRLAYSEHRPNWTAASVYRSPEGKVQAFVGESERQAIPTTYQFVSKDRDVFYDGVGPLRSFEVRTTGGSGYQTEAHKNAERVLNVTWGEDIQPAIDGRYTLVNRHSQKVMEVEGASSENGTNIVQRSPNYENHQSWLVNPLSNTSGGDWSYYSIKPFHNTEKTGDVWNWNFNDGADVRLYDYAGGTNQLWVLEYAEEGYFYIRSRFSGKYLEVANSSDAEGANIQLGDGPGGEHQQWRLLPANALVERSAPLTPESLRARAALASVHLNWTANTESDLGGYSIYRSTNPDSGYELIARDLDATSFVDKAANQEGVRYYYYIRATDRSLNHSPKSEIVSATVEGGSSRIVYLPFEDTGMDLSGNANHLSSRDTVGFVEGHAGGKSLYFNGATFYANLPATVGSFDALTISTWVYWGGGSSGQRIFDFNDGEGAGISLSPSSSEGQLSFRIAGSNSLVELTGTALAERTWTHLAVSLDGTEARLFVDGELVDSESSSVTPASLGTVLNYLGKSSQLGAPLFAGRLDELQVLNFPVSTEAVAALAGLAAPNGVPLLQGDFGEGEIFLVWSAAAGAKSYTLERALSEDGVFEEIASGLTENAFVDTQLGGENSFFYRVVPSNDLGLGTQSETIAVSAISPRDAWRILYFDTPDDSGDAADDADPDGDGIVNLLERALGGNPRVYDLDVLPKTDSTQPVLSVIYPMAKQATDLEIVVQERDSQTGDWNTAVGSLDSLEEDADIRWCRFTRHLVAGESVLLRLAVRVK